MPTTSIEYFAPLPHPRRDPLLRKARLGAAAICALANGGMFGLALFGISHGAEMNLAAIAVLLVALLIIGTRLPMLVEILIGVTDRAEGLESAPSSQDITRRLVVGVLAPWFIGGLALMHLGDLQVGFWCLAALLVLDIMYRFGGFSRWQSAPIATDILRAVFASDADRGALAFAQSPLLGAREFEVSALIVASLAIRRKSAHALDVLLGVARRRLEEYGGATDPRIQRTLLILEADRARLDDILAASEQEARALRETNAGHPRRLSLALFVATAALETDQPRAAIDALTRLHSRDVSASTARVVVNCLLREAARRTGDDSLLERTRRALSTFNLRREAEAISTEDLDDSVESDPYARWVTRVKAELLEPKTAAPT
jgi:hypothetical protein